MVLPRLLAQVLALLGACSEACLKILSRFSRKSPNEGREGDAPGSKRPESPRSGRARAETSVRASCLDSLAALVTVVLAALRGPGARALGFLAALAALASLVVLASSLAARASRSMIARFMLEAPFWPRSFGIVFVDLARSRKNEGMGIENH